VARLPVISGDECIRALSKIGYREARQVGCHIRLRCEGRSPVTVPRHKELDRGTLRQIIADAGLSVEAFVALL
jgi:predicted RNA binding protein YcfA (HicA-like mRNA interferase family)